MSKARNDDVCISACPAALPAVASRVVEFHEDGFEFGRQDGLIAYVTDGDGRVDGLWSE
jgi:hypothetical protein